MSTSTQTNAGGRGTKFDLVALIPFIGWHLLLVPGFLFIDFKWEYAALVVATYVLRMFGVTAGYHRYFSHRAFKTNRAFQFVLAFLAQTSAQKGVLWWAANHRHHHRHSDQEQDLHSPVRSGFWWSHMGWFMASDYEATRLESIRDFARFPELVWLNRFHAVPALVALGVMWLLGGVPWMFYGGVVSTVLLWHGTFTINSLSHIFGSRRYVTTDTSRNNFLLALLTMGEGWHNNHHFHQNTANQGWFWWELDATYAILKVLSFLGLVSDLRLVSDQTKYSYRAYGEAQQAQLAAEATFNLWRKPAPPTPSKTPDEVPALGGLAPQPLLKR
ncbi:MAG: acyl-CoA desaturase [Myxococcaceae bacterium]|jgi:stearoyl-CoA desaturase (delta-9 desaturase)|nr:acyl-CoA desaturase [Myxococcaceae bacterium]MCA3012893.1 acyl-CoA desaturase [Myxococcaceae bacterium]